MFLDGLIQVLISPFSPGQDSALLLAFFHDIFYPHIFHFSKQTFKIEQVIYGLVLRMLIIRHRFFYVNINSQYEASYEKCLIWVFGNLKE